MGEGRKCWEGMVILYEMVKVFEIDFVEWLGFYLKEISGGILGRVGVDI